MIIRYLFRKKDILRTFCLSALITAFIVVSLLPLLQSGYYSDDMSNSLYRPQQELTGGSFLNHFLQSNSHHIKSLGRLLTAKEFLSGAVYYYATNLLTHKIIILLLVVLNIFAFGHFVRITTGSKHLSYLLMLIIPSFFQFRLYHDPILAFGGHMQFFFLFLIASLIFLQKYLSGKRYAYLAMSVVLYNLCLYFYELSFVLLPVYLLLVFRAGRTFREAFITGFPFLASFLIALAMNLVVLFVWKDPASAGYSGTRMNFNTAIIPTFLIQIGAALPLSYYFGNPSKIFDHTLSELVSRAGLPCLLIVLFFTLLFLHLSKNLHKEDVKLRTLTLTGLIFFLAPAFLISLTEKYQTELIPFGFGMGYIPVYIQYYGLLMSLAGGFFYLLRSIPSGSGRKIIGFFVLASLDFILHVNLENNAVIVDKANIDLFYRRQALEEALKNNILQRLPENSRLLIVDKYTYDPYPPRIVSHLKGWASTGYEWKSNALVYQHSGRRLAVYSEIAKLLGDLDLKDGRIDYRKNNVYMLTIFSYPEELRKKEGYVVLRKIKNIKINQADINKSQIELENSGLTISDKE
jgi:hypothetical protein